MRLRDGQIDTTLFLKTMANPKNLLVFSDGQISILDAEVEISTNSELFEGPNDIVDMDEEIHRLPENDVLNLVPENESGGTI